MFTDIAQMPRANNKSGKRRLPAGAQSGRRYMANLQIGELGPYTAGGWNLASCLLTSLGAGAMTGMNIAASHACDGCQLVTPPPYIFVLDVTDIKNPMLKAYTDKDTELAEGTEPPADCEVCVEIYVC